MADDLRGGETVGIVGLGLLGSALAERLLAAGFIVTGFDIDPGRLVAAETLGVLPAATAAAVVGQARRVLLSLPNSDVVKSVMESLGEALHAGHVIIDTTTGDPAASATLGTLLAAQGVDYLDATVSGSSTVARQGQAVIMVGGPKAAYEANLDLFAPLARQTFYLGAWGKGSEMKLVVNLVLGLNRAALAEGLALAQRLGLDAAQALAVLKSGASYSAAMDAKGPRMISGEFAPEARLAQHHKDVLLILETGDRVSARLPLTQLHGKLLDEARAAGWGDLDNSAILKVFLNDTPDPTTKDDEGKKR